MLLVFSLCFFFLNINIYLSVFLQKKFFCVKKRELQIKRKKGALMKIIFLIYIVDCLLKINFVLKFCQYKYKKNIAYTGWSKEKFMVESVAQTNSLIDFFTIIFSLYLYTDNSLLTNI